MNAKQRDSIVRPMGWVMGAVSLVATILQTLAFSTPAWGVWSDRITGSRVYIGLWYSVTCDGPAGMCGTISHHQENVNLNARNITTANIQYALRVGHQVTATFAVVFAITGCTFMFHSAKRICQRPKFLLSAIISLTISGSFMLVLSGTWAGEIGAYMGNAGPKSRNDYKFPWSILLAGLGGILALLVALVDALLLCMLLSKPEEEPRSTEEFMMYEHPLQSPPDYSAAVANDNNSPSNSAIMYNNFSNKRREDLRPLNSARSDEDAREDDSDEDDDNLYKSVLEMNLFDK